MSYPQSLTKPARTTHLRELVGFAVRAAREVGADTSAQHDVRLAVEEVCTNIIVHGYTDRSEGPITVEVDASEAAVAVRIADEAPPFDPTALGPPDLDSPGEQREPGNLGWHLVRNVMDQVKYESRGERGNVLTLVKHLGPRAAAGP
jgi:serine/threonine-protein kinase RsbW